MTIRLAGISGSLRRRSYNTALLRAAQRMVPTDVELEIVSIRDLPLYDFDLEEGGFPAEVVAAREAVATADGLVIATPEYNYSVSGVLKNALDWLSRPPSPLDGKPVAIMGAGGGMGTVRAQMHLRDILLHNRMWALPGPQVFVARAGSSFDDDLRLVDEAIADRIAALLSELVTFLRDHR